MKAEDQESKTFFFFLVDMGLLLKKRKEKKKRRHKKQAHKNGVQTLTTEKELKSQEYHIKFISTEWLDNGHS